MCLMEYCKLAPRTFDDIWWIYKTRRLITASKERGAGYVWLYLGAKPSGRQVQMLVAELEPTSGSARFAWCSPYLAHLTKRGFSSRNGCASWSTGYRNSCKKDHKIFRSKLLARHFVTIYHLCSIFLLNSLKQFKCFVSFVKHISGEQSAILSLQV